MTHTILHTPPNRPSLPVGQRVITLVSRDGIEKGTTGKITGYYPLHSLPYAVVFNGTERSCYRSDELQLIETQGARPIRRSDVVLNVPPFMPAIPYVTEEPERPYPLKELLLDLARWALRSEKAGVVTGIVIVAAWCYVAWQIGQGWR